MKLWLFCLCLLPLWAQADDFFQQLATAAETRTRHDVRYDGRYFSIPYPGGDVPADVGVCTDVIIRSYRALGFDLQQAVHEDMQREFSAYPSRRLWGLRAPDANIDHRRVPNLQVFFTRAGQRLTVSENQQDYHPGELVTWRLPGNLPHIGIVSTQTATDTGRPLMVHNIGRGPQLEDMLFRFPITGHYRFSPQIVDPQ